ELLDLLHEGLLFFGEVEIHACVPPCSSPVLAAERDVSAGPSRRKRDAGCDRGRLVFACEDGTVAHTPFGRQGPPAAACAARPGRRAARSGDPARRMLYGAGKGLGGRRSCSTSGRSSTCPRSRSS